MLSKYPWSNRDRDRGSVNCFPAAHSARKQQSPVSLALNLLGLRTKADLTPTLTAEIPQMPIVDRTHTEQGVSWTPFPTVVRGGGEAEAQIGGRWVAIAGEGPRPPVPRYTPSVNVPLSGRKPPPFSQWHRPLGLQGVQLPEDLRLVLGSSHRPLPCSFILHMRQLSPREVTRLPRPRGWQHTPSRGIQISWDPFLAFPLDGGRFWLPEPWPRTCKRLRLHR